MKTLNEINEHISKYALFCKKGLGNNLIIIFNDKPIMKIAIEIGLPIDKLRTLNQMFRENQTLTSNMRFGIISSSKITGEIIRNAKNVDFFRQATKDDFPEIIYDTIISEFKDMKSISDKNSLMERSNLMPTLS